MTYNSLYDVKIDELIGKTIVRVVGGNENDEYVVFSCSDGTKYELVHEIECCEEVICKDINGDWKDIMYSPILQAEINSNDAEEGTWTFVRLSTIKGYVVLKWHGTSNGYYSEKPVFKRVLIDNYFRCKTCGVELQNGIAFIPEVKSSDEGTMYHEGGKLVNCKKCPACGHSVMF